MPPTCTICLHKSRKDIDRAIVEGNAVAAVARDFSVPYSTLWAHAQSHLSKTIVKAHEKQELVIANDLMDRINSIIARAERIFTRNYEKGKDHTALKALAEQRSTIDLLAKISYQLHQARMAELQLLKEKKIDIRAEEQAEFNQALEYLTFDELKDYQHLQMRLTEIMDRKVRKR